MVHPIIDQYYNHSPDHVRSSAFVQTKGLATNEKPDARLVAPNSILSSSPLPSTPSLSDAASHKSLDSSALSMASVAVTTPAPVYVEVAKS